jgi:hypothetical protein
VEDAREPAGGELRRARQPGHFTFFGLPGSPYPLFRPS